MSVSLNKFPLQSIKSRILIFTLAVTIIPASVLGWVYYRHTHNILLNNTEQELQSGINHAVRELELWFKDRSYDIRVFSHSFIVTENIEKLRGKETASSSERAAAITQIGDYLGLVGKRFPDFHRLLVLDMSGDIISESPQLDTPVRLPQNWRHQLNDKKMILGEVTSQEISGIPHLLIAVPILSTRGVIIGLLGAEVSLAGLEKVLDNVLKKTTNNDSSELFLLRGDGLRFLSTADRGDNGRFQNMPRATTEILFGSPGTLSQYSSLNGKTVVGILAPVDQIGWGVVMEKAQQEVFAEVIKLRNLSMLLAGLLLIVIGFISFLLSQSILSPLQRLIGAAGQVADGNLDVELPVKLHDEIGFAMSVFNNMVRQLKQSHEELETLSTTDSLTGLANRKQTMETLELQLERYYRSGTPFSILMLDIDHFKKINDGYGHLAGDMVLRKTGEIFTRLLRSVDTAGRYGGEEFLIILDQAAALEAEQTAERIRREFEQFVFDFEGDKIEVTVSIGASMVGHASSDASTLIRQADEALYEAKRGGRNRIIISREGKSNISRHPAQDKGRPS